MDQLINPADTSNTPRPEFGDRTSSEWIKLSQAEQKQVTREYNTKVLREQRERIAALATRIDEDRKAREQAAAAEAEAQRRAKLEADVKRSFLAAGGTEDEWVESGPKLVREHIEVVTADRMERDRAAMRARIASKF